MQRNIRFILTAAAALVAAVLAGCGDGGTEKPAPAPVAADRPGGVLIVVTPADTPPYSYRDANSGEITGLEIEIIRAAAKALGREVEIRECEFNSLLPKLKSGEADMAASSLSIVPVRLEDVDFTIPYVTEGGMFLYRAGEKMPTMIVAETIRVGTVDSMTHDFYLSGHGIDPVRFPFYSDAVEALKSYRIDAVYFDSSAVRLSVEESGGRLAASRLETRERFGIAIRKGMPWLKAALDAEIERRKGGGR